MELMRIDAVWKRWSETLAALVLALNERWRARRALSVAIEGKRLVVRSGAPPGSRGGAAASPSGAGLAAALASAGRHHFVTLELPPHEMVLQRISVPAQAREFLPGIVRNQIERLSPWPIDQVVFGFDTGANSTDPDQLDARVLMTSRGTLEAARAELAAMGVAADRIVAPADGGTGAPPVTLWSRFDSGTGRGLERARRLVSVAVLAAVAVSVVVSAWSLLSASAIQAQSEAAAARTATLQRQLQPSRAPSVSPTADPAARAWFLKETAPSGVIVLETLSRALPDTAYVTELSLQKSIVRLVGLTSDAPSLIAPLEHFGQFAEVHFFAPTTRGPDGRLFWFHIEARVEPHNGVAESTP
jgi:general secretion pathway protein L